MIELCSHQYLSQGFLSGSAVKNPPANAGATASIPRFRRSSGEENGNPLRYSCLENFMDRGAWRATVLGVAKRHDWACMHNTRLSAVYVRCAASPLWVITTCVVSCLFLVVFFLFFFNAPPFFFASPCVMWIFVVPLPGIKPTLPAMGAQS